MAADDPDCTYSIGLSKASYDAAMDELDERNLEARCRVIKHPQCCVLCAANNDCTKLPVHFRCRCRPEMYLTLEW